jgi:hypothetical protein
MPRAEGIDHDRDPPPRLPRCEIPGREQGSDMNRRLVFSVVLVVVLVGFWLVMARPT